MMFYILLFGAPILFSLFSIYLWKNRDGVLIIPVFLVFIIVELYPFAYWEAYADRLSIIHNQEKIILLANKEIDELNYLISNFNYPESKEIMNGDKPSSSIVDKLSEWHSVSFEAQSKIIEAKMDIESCRYGPMSGVISFVGDYK